MQRKKIRCICDEGILLLDYGEEEELLMKEARTLVYKSEITNSFLKTVHDLKKPPILSLPVANTSAITPAPAVIISGSYRFIYS